LAVLGQIDPTAAGWLGMSECVDDQLVKGLSHPGQPVRNVLKGAASGRVGR
jgi:hypothetical protein